MNKFLCDRPAKASIVFAPALGVRSSFYKSMAKYLNEQGFHVYLVQARIETESIAPKYWGFSYNHLIHVDFASVVNQAKQDFPDLPIFASGHSLGGQIALLYSSRFPDDIKGVMMVATGSPYWKGFPLAQALQIRLLSFLLPLFFLLFGYFPGDRVGFGGRESKGVMGDWNQLAKKNRFEIAKDNFEAFDYEQAVAKVSLPCLAVVMEKDDFAPPQAVNNIAGKLPEHVLTTLTQSNPNGKAFDHFSWAKSPEASMSSFLSWIDSQLTNK